ncbi:MAG TPA: phytanoyl-CoA dioxygenase family protein, partial [Solirubrobacterales bacterium]|nr:phytanoyl-CoA dioxygenase family protein [Solirubrobacterales bacterium]
MGLRERTAEMRHGLGRLRPAVAAGQLLHRRELEPARRRYRELGLRKPWFGSVNHAEVAGRGEGTARLDRDDGVAELESDERFAALDPKLQAGLREWPARGYLIAEGFFEPDSVAALNAEIDRLSATGDIREHHLDPRFMNVHRTSPAARALAEDPRALELIEIILGRRAGLFQTICFIRGSQQEAHSDAFHMMTEPPGFLVGVWVALEDIDEGSGPVFYVPGSHRLPYLMTEDLDLDDPPPLLIPDKGDAYVNRMRALVADSDVEPQTFSAKAGDVLFWHHNLTHGGSAVTRPGATRRSLVGH